MNLSKHAEGVRDISNILGEKLLRKERDKTILDIAAYYHDIGKLLIPKEILYKPDKLNELEYEIMKKHVIYSEKILRHYDIDKEIINIVKHHHERWDGKGYPDGLSGENIPLGSRIIAIADSYDAMINDRVYRKSITKEEAIKEIIRNKGTQFDPIIVEIIEKDISIFDNENIKIYNKINRKIYKNININIYTGGIRNV